QPRVLEPGTGLPSWYSRSPMVTVVPGADGRTQALGWERRGRLARVASGMVMPTVPPAEGSARMRSDQPPSVASVDRVRRALPSGFQPLVPSSKLLLASRLRGPGGTWPAAVVATPAAVVVGTPPPLLAAVVGVGRAAARPLDPLPPPVGDPSPPNPA